MLKEIPFTRFKKMLAREIKESKSFVVNADGELLFICIVPQTLYIEEGVKQFGVLSNAVGGKELEDEL